jgi:hypothetical protein
MINRRNSNLLNKAANLVDIQSHFMIFTAALRKEINNALQRSGSKRIYELVINSQIPGKNLVCIWFEKKILKKFMMWKDKPLLLIFYSTLFPCLNARLIYASSIPIAVAVSVDTLWIRNKNLPSEGNKLYS